jgi:hypothetical protein
MLSEKTKSKTLANLNLFQAISTENQFRFDHLREIDVIMGMVDLPCYRLLMIFTTGDLDDFENFLVQVDPASCGINDSNLVTLREKMKLLTLVMLAISNPEVSYK